MTQPDADFTTFSDRLDPDLSDIEAPEADAAEQAVPANPAEVPVALRLPFEADEFDALEQSQIVPDLDDDYR